MIKRAQRLCSPRICGLLASKPTGLSQRMHNAGFIHLGLPFTYVVFDTLDTSGAVESIKALGITGLSLTIPHKEQAFSLVDELSADAQQIGAINTIVNDGELLRGFNTDWYGIVQALKSSGVSLKGKKALILGAGGASRAAVYALKQMGASSIVICNRSDKRATDLARHFAIESLEYDKLSSYDLSKCDLLINATSLGSVLGPENPNYGFDLGRLASNNTVFDFVTAAKTPLTMAAEQASAKVVYGLQMLLFQALEQFRLFTGQEAPRDVMERALED